MSDPPEADPLVGATVADKYEVESVLGAGGMGTVFAARHTLSGRRVALKTLETPTDTSPAVDRFLREAQAMGRIEHPNVVAVLDAGVHRGAPFLVMELLSGESLRAVLEREGAMSHERAIALLMPALEGVEAAHRASVVHRDLKPENLFVCRERYGTQTTKVLDFGISKVKGGIDRAQTQAGMIMGTPYYMSPEQARGLPVDARADVWSLGVILYEMLAGRVPFMGDNLGALLLAIATEEPPTLSIVEPAIPPALARIIHRALAKDREARWPSVAHFAVALAQHAPGAAFREPVKLSERPPAPITRQADVATPRSSASPTVARPRGPNAPATRAGAVEPATPEPAPRSPEQARRSHEPTVRTDVPLEREEPSEALVVPSSFRPRTLLALALGAVAALGLVALLVDGGTRRTPIAAQHLAASEAPPLPAPRAEAVDPAPVAPVEPSIGPSPVAPPAVAPASLAPASPTTETAPGPRPRTAHRPHRSPGRLVTATPEAPPVHGRSGTLSAGEF